MCPKRGEGGCKSPISDFMCLDTLIDWQGMYTLAQHFASLLMQCQVSFSFMSLASDVASIHREEEGCIRGWKTQGCDRCERLLVYSESFLLLYLPQKRLWLAQQGKIQGSHGVGETWNKMMIIIYHSHEFLELLDGCRPWEIGN